MNNRDPADSQMQKIYFPLNESSLFMLISLQYLLFWDFFGALYKQTHL